MLHVQGPLPPSSDAGKPPVLPARKIRNLFALIFEILVATFGLAVGFFAYEAGMFMNVVFVMLILLAPITVLKFGVNLWRREISFDLFKHPFSPGSRKFVWPCLARILFFVACGLLINVAIVPMQFPQQTYQGIIVAVWLLVALQIVFVLVPTKRVSVPLSVFFTIGGIFICWQIVQALSSATGEKVSVRSPLKGVSCVVQGGNSLIVNHHYGLESQRYAVDFFKAADNLEQVGQWKILGDEASFGETIYSPCDGRIAFVEDFRPDNTKGKTDAKNPAGNYLTIEIATNRFLLLAHLKQKSITVNPGDIVRAGQPLAQCGNSGNTSGPHVHMQVQTSPRFSYDVSTVPMAFSDVVRKDAHLTNVQARRNDLLINEGK